MLLKQMKYFISVVECNSFTEAAEQCYISQSAISQQIKALEQELGVDLIKRNNRQFTLTPAGEYFYRHGVELVSEIDNLKRRNCTSRTRSGVIFKDRIFKMLWSSRITSCNR